MKATRIFLGIVVVLIGILWLLSNLNVISIATLIRLWRYWPLLLILWGLLLLFNKNSGENAGWWSLLYLVGVAVIVVILGLMVFFAPWFSHFSSRQVPMRSMRTAVRNIYAAERMRLELNLQAGELRLDSHSGEPLVDMNIEAGAEPKVTHRQKDNMAEIIIEDQQRTAVIAKQAPCWHFSLPRKMPVEIICNIGATDADLDLTGLQVEKLAVQTGAGDLTVKLPQVKCTIDINSGAANLLFYIPENVGIRLKADGAFLSVEDKDSRIINLGKQNYESKDLDTKEAIIDINVAAAAGSISLRGM